MSPLPDVSSTMRTPSVVGDVALPGERARAIAVSAAMTQRSVSSGEKNDVKTNGGWNARSLPDSSSNEGRVPDAATGRANR